LDCRRQRYERAAHLAEENERTAWRERNTQRIGARFRGESPADDSDEWSLVRGELTRFVQRLRDDRRETEGSEGLRQTLEER